MEYTIESIKGAFDSKYPDSKRYVFRVEEDQKELSVFSKFPLAVGQKIHGEIVQNGQYYNFKFGRKEESKEFQVGNAEIKNILIFKVIPMLTELLQRERGTYVEPPLGVKYPHADSSNDAHDFDDIPDRNTDELPF